MIHVPEVKDCYFVHFRAIISADKCLLFEPNSQNSKFFLEVITPKLQQAEGRRIMEQYRGAENAYPDEDEDKAYPFELDVVESALIVATGERCAESFREISGQIKVDRMWDLSPILRMTSLKSRDQIVLNIFHSRA